MQFQKIEKASYKSTTWAHGETTELYIYPEDGNYAERQFLWRVSSATVTSETSDFTNLFGVKRWIMPFDGSLFLSHSHNGKPLYSITLSPYESHCFKGDWETHSIGKVRDFNLMLKEGAYGIVKPVRLLPNTSKDLGHLFQDAFDERLPLTDHKLTLGMHSRDTSFEIQTGHDTINCSCEDLLFIHYSIEDVDQVKSFVLSNLRDELTNIVLFAVTY